MRGLLYGILTCFYFWCLADDSTKDILDEGQNIVEKLKDFSDAGLSLFAELNLMTATTAEFAKLFHPAALIGIAIAKTVIQPESVEAQMLKQIDTKITQKFVEMPHHVRYALDSAKAHTSAVKYEMEVTVNLDDIKSHLRHILAPDGPISPSAYDDFAARCKDVNTSPWNIIRRISLFMKCPKAVSTTVDDYLNINKMFQEMAKRQDGSELTDSDKIFLHYNEQFMRIFMLNNSTKFVTNIQEKVKSQKLSFHKIDNLKSFLDEELDFEESLLNAVGTGLCMIDDFIAKNHWTTETGLAMAISVESDIYLAYMIGGFCTGMAYDGPLGDQGKDLQKLFQSISGYANNRTLELLEATWPRIDLYQIEKLMKDVPFKGTKSEDLNQKAKKLWDNLKPIGPSGYSKQIVITGFSIVPNSYTLKCDPVFCTSYNSSINEAGKQGISSIVVRNRDPNFFIRSTSQWAETRRTKIESLLSEFYTIPSNEVFIDSIEHEIGPIITPERSHGYLLVRDFPYFATNCDVFVTGVQYDQLDVNHSNETLNKWRNGLTAMSFYATAGIFSSATCSFLYIFA